MNANNQRITDARNSFRVFCARIFTPNILLILLFEDGKNAGLGLWIFITSATAWMFSLFYNLTHPPVNGAVFVGVTTEQYIFMLFIAACLFGGETLIHSLMIIWKERNSVNSAASTTETTLKKTEEVSVKTDVQPGA